MSRIPPSLLYLTIYNPTLKPALLDPDDEDAEELAHILFHTAREHAVSRDKILRQVGLAKALVNFSEMFNAGVPCENVHSQARRMIMLSPEPNFWMHACYEVAKTPRPPSAAKAKEASKSNKGKGKETATRPAVLYDYHDGSVHDEALRTHFQRGYEGFKLIHGSFTSVLATHGQQALELQLERFFTIWAWKWDIEDEDFGSHLGIPVHPLHSRLTPLLESFSSKLPEELMTFALIPPYVIPPRSPRYPSALVHYVLSRIPPPPTPVAQANSSGPGPSPVTPPAPSKPATSAPAANTSDHKQETNTSAAAITSSLLAIPSMPSMNLGLDPKSFKWNWPGYLTFGKSAPSSKPSSLPQTPRAVTVERAEPTADPKAEASEGLRPDGRPSGRQRETLDVDAASLLEAISTESIGSYTRAASPAPSVLSKSSQLGETSGQDATENLSPVESGDSPANGNADATEVSEDAPAIQLNVASDTPARASRSFLRSPIHLSQPDDPVATEMKRVLHLTDDDCTVAIVMDMDHTLDLVQLADDTVALIESMRQVIEEEKAKDRDKPIPSATKILQPKDTFVIAREEYTMMSSAGFTSRSEHLYNAQKLLRSDHGVLEVFSRGQNPQHWHIGKRGLGTAADGEAVDGEAYMEVSRKETSLQDVDNKLAGVLRRYIEHL
ncbi:hypothetical protein C8Q77DRAFT_1142379 [Trametes polyzona]|nr:hypothetical protein C8Q77DRAFT_1142379 [Trametes polyzona]